MTQRAFRQNEPEPEYSVARSGHRELPIGSELLIAFTLGAAGWWAILITIRWAAG